MSRLARRSRFTFDWIVLGVIIGGLVLLLLVFLWPRTTREREHVVDQDASDLRVEEPADAASPPPELPAGGIGEFERRIAATLARERVRTQPLAGPVRIRASDIRLDDPARREPILRAQSVVGFIELPARPGAPTVVRDLVLASAEFHLVRPAPGAAWNFERAFDRAGVAQPVGRPGPAVVLRSVTVRQAQLIVRDADDMWELRDVAASIPAASLPRGPGAGVTIASLSGTLVVPHDDFGPAPFAVENARLALPTAGFTLEADRIRLGQTIVVGLHARVDPARPVPGLVATGRVAQLRFEDVGFLHPGLPGTGTAGFAFRVETVAAGRYLVHLDNLDARAAGSHVTGAVRFLAGGERPFELQHANLRLDPLQLALLEPFAGPLPYGGTLTGTLRTVDGEVAFDVAARLTSPLAAAPFRMDLAGRAALTADGVALRRLEARLHDVPLVALRTVAPGVPLTGSVTGTLLLAGPPARAPLNLDVALTLADGTLTLAGTLDLTGPVPAYDVGGRLASIDLRRLLEPSLPPVILNAQFSARGAGFDPASMDARVALTGTFHGWHTRPGDGVRLNAALAGGTLRLDTLHAVAGPVLAAVAGDWRLVEPAAGALRYQVQVTDLQPLTPFLPATAGVAVTGRVATSGTLSGTLALPTFAGQADGGGVRWGVWRASEFTARYALQPGLDPPRVVLTAAGRGVEAPLVGALAAAQLELQLTEPTFLLELAGQRLPGGSIELAADGTLVPGALNTATLRRFALDLEEERWALVQPALIHWGGDPFELHVDALHIEQVDGAGAVLAAGRLLPAERAALRAEIRDLPLGDVFRWVGPAPEVRGRLWATADVMTLADGPRIAADFRLEQAVLAGVPLSAVTGSLNYDGAFLTARSTVLPAHGGSAELEVRVRGDLALGVPPRLDIPTDAPILASAVLDSVPLAPFGALIPQVSEMSGVASGRVTVSGRQDAPELAGEVYIRAGEALVIPLNQRYREIEGDLVLTDRRLLVRQLRARSDGWVTVSGAVEFEELRDPVADLAIELDRFRAVGVDDQVDAALWGTMAVRGPLRLPTITGAVLVDDGSIGLPTGTGVPDLGFGDDLIEPLAPEGGAPGLPGAIGVPTAPWFRGWVVEGLSVRLGRSVWVASRELRVQLAGDLTIYRQLDETRVYGDLSGERGNFTLQIGPIIRRFDIVAANVRFFGAPQPDPAIDVTASRIVFGPGGTEIEILARVGGTVSYPTLTLSTGTGVPIPESELLSFLLFGQPSFALGETGLVSGGVFQGIIAGGLVDLAAMELEHALIDVIGLPLDFVHIRPGQGTLGFEGATLILGRQVARDLFVTVDAGLSGIFGDVPTRNTLAVRLEWRIDREWRLRLGIEPVDRRRFYDIDLPGDAAAAADQQITVEIRRRWTY
jgi:hypothetical protein